MTTADARLQLQRMTAADVLPRLTDEEITDLLAGAQRVDRGGVAPDGYPDWAAQTPYALGGQVVPRTRNAHVYTVTTAGTSGGSEPTWPTSAGATVTDGTVVWTEAGTTTWTPTWDLNAAAAEGWRWKMGKCSEAYAFTNAGQSFHREEVFAHCERMARFYARRVAVVVAVPGGLRAGASGWTPSNRDG